MRGFFAALRMTALKGWGRTSEGRRRGKMRRFFAPLRMTIWEVRVRMTTLEGRRSLRGLEVAEGVDGDGRLAGFAAGWRSGWVGVGRAFGGFLDGAADQVAGAEADGQSQREHDAAEEDAEGEVDDGAADLQMVQHHRSGEHQDQPLYPFRQHAGVVETGVDAPISTERDRKRAIRLPARSMAMAPIAWVRYGSSSFEVSELLE